MTKRKQISGKQYFGYLVENFKNSFDFLSIAPFIGRWIPVSFSIGITTGLIAAVFDILITKINQFLHTFFPSLFVYPIIVALITAYCLSLEPSIGGPGIGYAILHLRTRKYIPFRAILLKFFTSVLTLSGTFIAGREGPSFYIGVAVGEWFGKLHGFPKKYKPFLALIGAGAFTGALLKAPLGSAIFAMELEKTYDLNYKPFAPVLVSAIVSYLTFSFFRGKHHFIPLTKVPHWDLIVIPYILIMGLVTSFIIYIYSVIYHSSNYIVEYVKQEKTRLLLGTASAIPIFLILYVAISEDILSAPANMKILALLAQTPFPIWKDIVIIAGVILTTSLTLSLGIPGGLVLPNLLIGIAIGNIFGNYFPQYIEVFTIAGMGAALAAGAKTPLAAIVMITEMTHADLVIPMTAAIITSYITSFGFHLYKGQIFEKPFDVKGNRLEK